MGQQSSAVPQLTAVGQVQRKWILAINQSTNSRYIVDQHAASQRIRYHSFTAWLAALPQLSPDPQFTVESCWVPLPKLVPHKLESFGFVMNQSHATQAHILWGRRFKDQLPSLVDQLLAGDRIPRVIDSYLGDKACKGGIKFGDILSLSQCQTLLTQLSRTPQGLQCVHGRPTMAQIL